MSTSGQALVRLLHLVSPALPTGAFAYSQGLEWAIETGWVHDGDSLHKWLADLLDQSMAWVDIPLLARMYDACRKKDRSALTKWCFLLMACRETRELRQEEGDRGRAVSALLNGLEVPLAESWQDTIKGCQLAGFALAAAMWHIPLLNAAMGYVWSWLENQVTAGIKTIPLGQTEGHRILLEMGRSVPAVVSKGLEIGDDEIGAACPALALACSRHETQYTRLYRS